MSYPGLLKQALALCAAMAVVAPCNAQVPDKQLDELEAQVSVTQPGQAVFDALQDIVRKQPNNARAHYILGCALKKLGYVELCHEQFLDVLAADPQFAAQLKQQFLEALDREDFAAAFDRLDFMRQVYPNDASIFYLDGIGLRQEGQMGQAAAAYTAALRHAPRLVGPASGLAGIALLRGDTAEAIRLAQFDLKRNPHHHEANVVIGQALMSQQKYKEAVEPLRVAYEKAPGWLGSGYVYAQALIRTGAYKEALEPCLVDMAVERKLSQLENVKEQAIFLFQHASEDEKRAAILSADKRLKTELRHRLYFTVADVMDRVGDHLDAVAVREAGLKLRPNYARGYYRMGQSMDSCRFFQEALYNYHKAHEFEPSNPDYLFAYERSSQRMKNSENDIAWRIKVWLQRMTAPPRKPMDIPKPV